MTSSMMGYCSEFGGRRASHKLRHQQHGKAGRNPFFREEQTSAFQGHQFELLEQNPPSFNPDYVGNPPSYNPSTTPRSVSSSSSSMFGDEAFLALDSPAAHPRHCRRRSNNNPFEDNDVPCISVQAVPVASAVAISDTEEEEIPFVSALPVKSDGNDHELHIYESPRPTMVEPQNLRPATRAARPPQAEFPQWRERPPVAQHQQRNEIPTWLVLNPNAQRTISANASHASRCANRTQRRWSGSNPRPQRSKPRSSSLVTTTNRGNWSRISVLTRAAAGDARRNFSKKAPSCNGYRRW